MTLNIQPCTGMGGGGTASTTKNCIVDSATGSQEEIISMGNGPNGPIYYTKSTSAAGPGQAWAQRAYTRNMQGDLYSVYGTGAVPRQINNPQPYAGTPVTSADPQDFTYLEDSAPGAGAFKKMTTYIGGWWMNIFGLRKEPAPQTLQAEGFDIPNMNIIVGVVAAGMIYHIMRKK